MLYPRTTKAGKLVNCDQMVEIGEHLLNSHRILLLSGGISGAMELPAGLLALDSLSNEPIKLIITSGGGDLDAAFLLYDLMKLIKSPIYTFGRYCASAAALIFAAGKERYLSPHAKVMLHLPQTILSGGFGLKEEDIGVIHREAAKYRERMVEALIECGARKSASEILRDVKDADFWLEPQEAIDYGVADELMTEKTMGVWLT